MKKGTKQKKVNPSKEELYAYLFFEDIIDNLDNTIDSLQLEFDYGMIPRRLKILVIPLSHVLSLMCGTAIMEPVDGIPEDAWPVKMFEETGTNSICLILTHSSFDVVGDEYMIPRITANISYISPTPKLNISNIPYLEEDFSERQI